VGIFDRKKRSHKILKLPSARDYFLYNVSVVQGMKGMILMNANNSFVLVDLDNEQEAKFTIKAEIGVFKFNARRLVYLREKNMIKMNLQVQPDSLRKESLLLKLNLLPE